MTASTGRNLTMASPLDTVPEWIKSAATLLSGVLGGAGIGAFFKYRSDSQGHRVTAERNADEHTEHLVVTLTEKLLAPLKEVMAEEHARLREEIKEVRFDYKALSDKYERLTGAHALCEAKILTLNEKVQGLIRGQENAAMLAAKREQELKDDLLEQRLLNDKLIQGRQIDHLADQVEKNAEALKAKGEQP